MDIRSHNRIAWNRLVEHDNRWTIPVSETEITDARLGRFQILLTPAKPVPMDWFPKLHDTATLCLAASGGQQAPILAAAGARVTVLDNSPRQLEQDRAVAHREGLLLELIEGDMADLSMFSDEFFDFIFHPCSNSFVPNVLPVWTEAFRVMRPGGVLLSGFANPLRYLFDEERMENGDMSVKHPLPYADTDHLEEPHIKEIVAKGGALEFSHTLSAQIGGQLTAGFVMTGFFEDRYGAGEYDPISLYTDTFIATRAVKS